jgi:hypothetical protein
LATRVAGLREAGRRAVEVEAIEAGVRFAARCPDDVVRATTVTADPAPTAVIGGRLSFRLRLQPGHAANVLLRDDLHEKAAMPPCSLPASACTRTGSSTRSASAGRRSRAG